MESGIRAIDESDNDDEDRLSFELGRTLTPIPVFSPANMAI